MNININPLKPWEGSRSYHVQEIPKLPDLGLVIGNFSLRGVKAEMVSENLWLVVEEWLDFVAMEKMETEKAKARVGKYL